MKRAMVLILVFGLIISGCGSKSDDGAALATEQYIRALSAKDKAQITNLSCKEWEESAILEVDGLLSVESEISELSCETVGEEGDDMLVICSGSLDLTYNDEIRAIDLSRRTYHLQQVEGQWRVCSYQ
jgi:hypothetical protein